MPRTPGERRADRLALDRGADLADLRLGLPVLGRRAIELGARDHALVEQPLHPLEVQARELALRLDGRELRLLLPRVEHRQHLAGADRLAGVERDPFDGAGQVGAHGHALHGRHRADRVSVAGHSSCATIVVTASGGG